MPGRARVLEVIITIAELGEFGLIAAITAALPGGWGLDVGPGDDAAVLRVPDGRVVATTDLLIEGRHFRRDWSSAADVGHRAAARNLADIAAMGARPTAVLVGFAGPGDTPADWVLELVAGMARECAAVGASIAGGDTSSAENVMLAVTALGSLDGRDPVTRSGARPGDVLAVAGTLGSAAAGLALLTAGVDQAGQPELAGLVRAYQRPSPPYDAGPQAATSGASSMVDISDGLIADLGHVADASGVQIEIWSGRLAAEPVAAVSALSAAAAALGSPDWLRWVLTGGDDHALAATFDRGAVPPGRWTVVGEVRPGRGVVVDGRQWSESGGWDHFRT